LKRLCAHETCECVEVGNPFCSRITACLCLSMQCSFPKIDGSPTCVCFNKKLAGGETDAWKPQLFDYDFSFDTQFWVYYLLCMGCAVNGPGANSRPMIADKRKCLCCKYGCQCVELCEDDVWCSQLGTALCYWDQCSWPIAEGAPKCAICGVRLGDKEKPEQGANKPAPMSYGKPGQDVMIK
jgi:hypothetical protein